MTEKEMNCARELKKRIRELEWNLKALSKAAENLVPALDGLPHSKEIKSRVEKIALSIAEKETELANFREQFIKAALDLNNKIENAPLTSQEKTVLSLRYVSCMTFRDIWLNLETSDAKVFYLHRSALKKFLKN